MLFHYVTEQDKAQSSGFEPAALGREGKGILGVQVLVLVNGGRSAWEPSRTHDQVLDHHSRHRDPIVADRLASALLARVVQSDALAGCGEENWTGSFGVFSPVLHFCLQDTDSVLLTRS